MAELKVGDWVQWTHVGGGRKGKPGDRRGTKPIRDLLSAMTGREV